MRFVRYRYENRIFFGILEGDAVQRITLTPFVDWEKTHEVRRLEEVRLLAPVEPSKVVAVGLNYVSHADELRMDVPDEPVLFLKPPTAVIGPDETIRYPEMSRQVDYEAELAIVIGRETKDVALDNATGAVLGYTCANDVTARDLQRRDGQWTRAKSFDTFAPIGPWIETDLDPAEVSIECLLNGALTQSGSTADMIFGVPALVSFISRVMTLLPGDVIMTGTPPGVGPMQPGDVVEVRVQGVGSLRNLIA